MLMLLVVPRGRTIGCCADVEPVETGAGCGWIVDCWVVELLGWDCWGCCAVVNANINSYNISSANLNNRINNRLYNNYTEKKRVNELKYDSRKLNNYISNDNLNQTSFNDFLFFKNKSKNKNNEKDNGNYYDKYKFKNKEENSNAPTCESSNIRLSINDFSIRKSYRFKNKNTKNEGSTEEKMNLSPKNEKNKRLEKEMRKGMEKTKSYNKLTNNKISFSESTFNRKTGVRKFYKQKNLENHWEYYFLK